MQEIDHAANPFPGLRPFESTETHLFFGRDGQSEELLRRLKRTRFLAVVGTSGSGKSSLVRADQFEELFRFKQLIEEEKSKEDAAAFVKLLLEAVGQTAEKIYIVLTMRSDFLGDCSQFW